MTIEKKNNTARQVATVISYLLHPSYIPLFAVALLIFGGTYLVFLPPSMKQFDLTLVFLNTLLLPLAYMHVLRRLGTIRSYHLESRRERLLPVALYTLLLLITWLILRRVRQPAILTDLFLALTLTSALTWAVTLRYKISLHLTGWGALSALLLATALRLTPVFLVFWLLSLLLAGTAATTRLLLHRHTPAEVYAAFLLGFTTTLLVLLF
jgi:hypothetical protein